MKARIPIETCARCVELPQSAETNHKHEDDRLPKLRELEEICFHERSDDDGEMHWSTTVLRCPECRTAYLSEWFEDEGHSFMDPTTDETKDRRLTPVEAIAALAKQKWIRGDAEPARKEILASRESVVDGLRTLLVEGRAPNEQILLHATACILDRALDSGEHDDIRTVLARATDPMVRVEAVARLRHLGIDIGIEAGTPELRARAKELLEEEDTGVFLAGELVEVVRQQAKPYREGWKKNTHDRAATLLGGLVEIREPVHREVLDALLALLLDDDANVVKAAVAGLEHTRWIRYGKSVGALADAFAAWSKKHPANVHAQKLARDFEGWAKQDERLQKKS